MRVVHIVEAFGGGVFDFLVNLTSGLNDIEHIIVYSLREETPQDFQKYFGKNTKFIQWPYAQRKINLIQDIKAAINLWRILKDLDADAYHLHSSKAWFLGRLVLRILGRSSKTIYSIHWIAFLDPDFWPLKQKLYKLFEKIAFKFGGEVIGNSKFEAQVFNSNGIKAWWISNTFNCRAIEKHHGQKDNKSQNIVVANMGRLVKIKGPELFWEIANHFVRHWNIEFWWIWWGDTLSKFNFPSNVKISWWLPHPEAIHKLALIDIFLFTSFSEAVPLAVLEAMCLWKPVVSRKIPGVEEVIKHWENWFLFESVQEAIWILHMLIREPSLRHKIGSKGKQDLMHRFSFERWLTEYRSLYQKIAQKSKK